MAVAKQRHLSRVCFSPLAAVVLLQATHAQQVEFDCAAGYVNWKRGWSDAKKKWCCTYQGVACVDGHDYPAGPYTLAAPTFAEHVCQGEDQEYGDCAPQAACKECTPIDCVFSDWGAWYDSGGCVGLKFRHRAVKVASNECGKPCEGPKIESVKHVKAECVAEVRDCVFEDWSEWSTCASIMDQAVRTRGVQQEPTTDGAPCSGNLRQTRPCGGPERQDCQFAPWREWTQCSATCGEGRHSRMRRIEVEAAHGGDTCDDMLLEAQPCMTRECPREDCMLGDWSMWTACTSHHGQRHRHRQIIQPPIGQGRPCEKSLMETGPCPGHREVDCEVTEWTEWSECTKSCLGGQKYRERELKTPNSHGGQCPTVTLKAVEKCNTGPCEKEILDCVLSSWTMWSECSVCVGKGVRSRVRILERPATAQGSGCVGPLAEVGSCEVHREDEVDCVWAEWDEWSACSSSCGGGTKRRTRVIQRSAENGGAQCQAETKSEVAICNAHECDKGCVDGKWSQWMDWTECTATCDSGYMSRARTLAVQANKCGKPASGLREEFRVCPDMPPCVEDRDCVLSEWEEWSHCSCSCFGVRERNRHIAIYSAGKGDPCSTKALKVIEPCNPSISEVAPEHCGVEEAKDCMLSDWSEWTKCTAPCGGGQTTRKRRIAETAKGGGRPCEDDLIITEPCNVAPCEAVVCRDCTWQEWSDWSECTECGGQRTRHRAVGTLPNHCGKPCDHRSVSEVSTCTSACEEAYFCAWTDWTEPTCSGRCGQQTTMRSRELRLAREADDYLFQAKSDAECRGTQLSVMPCGHVEDCRATCSPRNCELGEWGDWAAATCSGLCERQRVITAMNNECGSPCNGNLLETKHCPAPCDESKDCVMSSWSQWTDCSARLDGQRYRKREILQEPKFDGIPCNAHLNETRACNLPDPEPCRMEAWSEWSSCSKTCGVGLKTRNRGISATAVNGGEQCAGSMRQLQGCSARDCDVEPRQDCLLSKWTAWSECNADGQRERTREIVRAASGGGDQCHGTMHDTESCNLQAVDCEISEWTRWDECDRSCGAGQTRRQRQIHRFPEHGGKLCPAVLIQTKGCNSKPCQVLDCLVSGWAEWSACSTSCGAGMQSRHREVVRLRGEGGAGCFFELGETRQCTEQPSCGVKDCELSHWGEWGECSVTCSGGFRRRARDILRMPDVGGEACPSEVLQEVEPCGLGECHKPCYDGHFGPWSNWAPCSVSCQGGTTFRVRRIAKMANSCGKEPEGMDREEKFCNVDVPCNLPKDCLFNEWTSWSDCSATCNGVKRRSRTVAQYGRGEGAYCEGDLKQTWPCNPSEGELVAEECLPAPDVDCVLSDWEGWSACSASCGGGMHMRSRSIVQHPLNRGKTCDKALSEIRECARNSCGGPSAVDCAYGDWEDWQACSRCDGERKRTREILAYAANGGRACNSFDSEEVGSCPRKCGEPTFCTWTSWAPWSRCSTPCGTGGKRHRRRQLELSSEPPAGLPPPSGSPSSPWRSADAGAAAAGGAENAIKRYEMLYHETKELEVHHVYEIATAFVAGGLALLAGMAVFRGVGRGRGGTRLLPAGGDGGRTFAGPRASQRVAQATATASSSAYADLGDTSETHVPLVAPPSLQRGPSAAAAPGGLPAALE